MIRTYPPSLLVPVWHSEIHTFFHVCKLGTAALSVVRTTSSIGQKNGYDGFLALGPDLSWRQEIFRASFRPNNLNFPVNEPLMLDFLKSRQTDC